MDSFCVVTTHLCSCQCQRLPVITKENHILHVLFYRLDLKYSAAAKSLATSWYFNTLAWCSFNLQDMKTVGAIIIKAELCLSFSKGGAWQRIITTNTKMMAQLCHDQHEKPEKSQRFMKILRVVLVCSQTDLYAGRYSKEWKPNQGAKSNFHDLDFVH